MSFQKYMHLERYGTPLVEGIEDGIVEVFPKLDGTNGSIWWDDGLKAGSRNRLLSVGNDNAGFLNAMLSSDKHVRLVRENPTYIFYGEWLVPHTLNTYTEDAWRKFYIFDVYDRERDLYLPFKEYQEMLNPYYVDYVPRYKIIRGGTYEHFVKCVQENTFLIKEGCGVGEGVVLKDYSFVNNHGKTVFAKLLSNAFKAEHLREMGAPEIGPDLIEEKIVGEIITPHFVHKVKDKITLEEEWSKKLIPRLLSTVWYELITEEIYNCVKKHKNPKIDFGRLNRLTLVRTKLLLPEVFE